MTLCDCHSAPCFKIFQYIHVGLYSVLEFYHLFYFKIQKLVEKYMYYFICYYLAQLLVATYRITAMVSRCVLGCAPPLTSASSAAQCRFWLHAGCCVLLRGVSFWSFVPVWLSCSEGPFRLWVHQHGMISPLSCVPC